MTPKYTTLTELSAAFRSGELDASYYVQVSSNGCSLTLKQRGPSDVAGTYCLTDTDAEDARAEHCWTLFQREFESPLDELLNLVGIPAEWC